MIEEGNGGGGGEVGLWRSVRWGSDCRGDEKRGGGKKGWLLICRLRRGDMGFAGNGDEREIFV